MSLFTSNVVRIIVSLISGAFFGSGMIISDMVNPNKVIAFLNITGDWDPSLAFVMGGALLVFIPIYQFVIKKRTVAINGDKFTWKNNHSVDSRLIIGAITFGIGWGLSGFCPGPVIASIGNGSNISLAFILNLIIGIVCANQYIAGRLALPIWGYQK